METIHQRIKRLRQDKGMSMQALAAAAGVSSWQTVQQWEGGGEKPTAPSRKRQEAVARALGVSVEELMHGTPGRSDLDRDGKYKAPSEQLLSNTAAERLLAPSQAVRELVRIIEDAPPLSDEDVRILDMLVRRMKEGPRHKTRVTRSTIIKTDKKDNPHRQTSSGATYLTVPVNPSTPDDEKKSLGGKPEGRE